jgi:methionyl aminopeptidase
LIFRKSLDQIDRIRDSCRIVYQVQQKLKKLVEPGICTLELDAVAERTIRAAGALPAFKGYNGFPASICASNNESIVHGFPCKVPLSTGDILSIDVGVKLNGYFGDGAFTLGVGDLDKDRKRFVETTQECLVLGIKEMMPDGHLGNISHAIQTHAETCGFSVIREYGGHGIGKKLHEAPHINNYGIAKKGPRLKVGYVFCIEPILGMGEAEIKHGDDDWNVFTKDRLPAAHFEHTVAINENGPEILTLAKS